jgi:uncharacterized membrane protein YvbJ
MFCTNCGTSNKEDEKFCIQCGELLAEPEIKKSPSSERMLKKAGLLRALFDFSFDELVTPKITKFLYILSILYAVLLASLCIIVGLNISTGFGILIFIIGALLIFVLTIIYSRVLIEMVIVTLRMAHHMAEILKKTGSKDGIHWHI